MLTERVCSKSLSTRVMVSLVVLVAFLAAGYSFALWRSIHFVETYLVSQTMVEDFAHFVEDLAQGRTPVLDPGEVLYGDTPGLPSVPERFKDVSPGYNEIGDKPAVYAYRGQFQGGELLYVRDQEGFEEQENLIWLQMGGMGLLLLIASGILGLWFARRVILTPVERLAREVRQAASSQGYRPIAEEFMTSDEIGMLARICDKSLKRLSDALEREKAFTADVSHELRTPLTVIGTSAELLELSRLDERQRRQVERIMNAQETMKNLVELFLQLARQSHLRDSMQDQTGVLDATESADAVSVVIESCIAFWRETAEKKGLLVKAVHTARCPGHYSALVLGTVVNNLLRNAVTYTQSGSVMVEETATGFVVRDTGPGIVPEDRQRIFEAFEQGTGVPAPRAGSAEQKKGQGKASGGVGLGLNITSRICRRLGWRIRILDVEKGSAFEVTLSGASVHERLDVQEPQSR